MNIEVLYNLPDAEKAKIFAARLALRSVESGMKIGIGTGSTAAWFVRLLAKAHKNGLDFRACATSSATTELAESLGIKIETLDALVYHSREPHSLDLVIDGADEFDSAYNLIKGGGGALLQEKIVEQMAEWFIVITDKSKEVETLGKFPLPVEVVRFGWQTTQMQIERILEAAVVSGRLEQSKITRRMAGDEPFITDEGHYILDLHLGSIADPVALDSSLRKIAGVVETGLFLGLANEIIMADSQGSARSREKSGSWEEFCYDWDETFVMLLEE